MDLEICPLCGRAWEDGHVAVCPEVAISIRPSLSFLSMEEGLTGLSDPLERARYFIGGYLATLPERWAIVRTELTASGSVKVWAEKSPGAILAFPSLN